jgi:hypothetical protein
MQKKEYQRPTVDIVELKHTGILMTSGDVSATMNGTFTETDLAREFDFEDDDLSTLMDE